MDRRLLYKIEISQKSLKFNNTYENIPVFEPISCTIGADLVIEVWNSGVLELIIPAHKQFISENVPQ